MLDSNIKILDKYLSARSNYVSDKTISQEKGMLGGFLKFLNKPVKNTTIDDFDGYLNHVNVNNGTKKIYLTTLKKLFEYLINRNIYVGTNPVVMKMSEMGKISYTPDNHEEEPLTTDDIKKLLKVVLSPRDRLILLMYPKLGLRLNEIRNIDVDDVDMINRKITVRGRKNNKTTIFPMDQEIFDAMRIWLVIRKNDQNPALFNTKSGRMARITFAQTIKKYGKMVGIEIHAHKFRYWFTETLANAHVPFHVIEVLRSDSPNSMSSYYSRKVSFEIVEEEYLRAMPSLLV